MTLSIQEFAEHVGKQVGVSPVAMLDALLNSAKDMPAADVNEAACWLIRRGQHYETKGRLEAKP